jgi:hypothetical protein
MLRKSDHASKRAEAGARGWLIGDGSDSRCFWMFVGRENAFSRDSTASHRSSVPACESPSSPGEGPPQTPPRSGRPPGVADGLPGPPHARASGSRSHLRCHRFSRLGLRRNEPACFKGILPSRRQGHPSFGCACNPGTHP